MFKVGDTIRFKWDVAYAGSDDPAGKKYDGQLGIITRVDALEYTVLLFDGKMLCIAHHEALPVFDFDSIYNEVAHG